MPNVTADKEYLKRLTVLFVEDDADCRAQIGAFLLRSVGTLVYAVNGLEGRDMFLKHTPHIVVTDIIMPVMDGLSMSEAILRMDPSVPVVVLTGFDDARYLMRAINMGIEKYVTKPIKSEALYNCLLECAHRLRLEEEAQRYYEYTENELISSELKFRNLFEYSRDACLLLYDGKFIDCNRATVENLHAKSINDVINTSPDELSPEYQPDGMLSRDKAPILVAKALETGSNRFEWIHRRLDNGEEFPVEVSLTHLSGEMIYVVWHDITERKRAEKALEWSEKRYRNLIENVPAIFYNYSTKVGGLYYSPQVEKLFGYPLQAFYDNPHLWRDSIHPDDLTAVEKAIGRISECAEYRFDIEYRIRTDAGEWIWLRDSSYNQLVSDDETVIHGFAQDITYLKQAEEEKMKLESQLCQSQKMEAIGQLAGGVAHDFNNMLGVILGYSEMALMNMEQTHPLHDNLLQICNAARRSADLTRQLLAFARKQVILPQVMDLNGAVSAMLKMLQRLIGEDIQLIWQPAANLWQVKADTAQIDQILANLCVNARYAIENNGRITIETKNNTIDAGFCQEQPDVIPGEYVHLSVSDNGCGMDTETMAHIFEPFFTTKDVGEGTGLGLATVYGIVKQNHGFITVSSQLGEGTTFSIHLPRHRDTTEKPEAKTEVPPLKRGQETILVVEDEPIILEMATIMLEMQGYNVLSAGTPNEAIQLAQAHNGEISLLITDVIMPGMNGREMANRLVSIFPAMKRIYMSGYSVDVIDRHGILDEGMHFIQKPFSLPVLANKVREVLDNNHRQCSDA